MVEKEEEQEEDGGEQPLLPMDLSTQAPPIVEEEEAEEEGKASTAAGQGGNEGGSTEESGGADAAEIRPEQHPFASLSVEELQMTAARLLKCHEGLHEMLALAVMERAELLEEKSDLDAAIAVTMTDIHRGQQQQQRLKPKGIAEVWQKAVQRQQRLPGLLVARQRHARRPSVRAGAARGRPTVGRAAEPVAPTAVAEEASVPVQASAAAEAVAAAAPMLKKSSPPGKQEAKVVELRKAGADRRKVAEKTAPDSPEVAKTVDYNAVLRKTPVADRVKTKQVTPVDPTVIIEAKVTLADGSVKTLSVSMTETWEVAAKRFVNEHQQRVWFAQPLAACLRKVEAEGIKLPSQVDANLVELRKQYAKTVLAATCA